MTGLFTGVARPLLVAAARSDLLARTAQRLTATRTLAQRFVPGETCADVLRAGAGLRDSGLLVSVDYLGEDITDIIDTHASVAAYLELIDAVGREGAGVVGHGACPVELSVKLSALGQALDRDGEKIALENAHTICERAAAQGVWVTVDAEDHTTTDSTLSIVADLHKDFPWLGVAVQAYLRRTLGDCRDLSSARIRLCKGAYAEPASVAYRDRAAVTAAYLRCLRVLMAGAGYPMVATHDPVIIAAAAPMAATYGRGAADFEYQMLYGIRDAEQRRLADAGHLVRVYLPFGAHWYRYFMRRLAERPANLAFFGRALVQRSSPSATSGKPEV